MEVVSRYGSSGAWGARANFDAKQRISPVDVGRCTTRTKTCLTRVWQDFCSAADDQSVGALEASYGDRAKPDKTRTRPHATRCTQKVDCPGYAHQQQMSDS